MKVLFTALLALMVCLPAGADDVTDWIDDGLKAYKSGNNQEAMQSLEYAVQLIRQQKGEEMETVFPDAPKGWKKLDSTSNAVGSAYLGGGTSAGASYERADGSGDSMDISMTTDNPMIGMLSAAFASPMMMGASGQKLIKVGGQKASLEYDKSDRSGDISLVIANKVMVVLSGYGVSEQELRDFAAEIDYKAIEAVAGN